MRFGRLIKRLVITVLTVCLFLAAIGVIIFVFGYSTVDAQADEALFRAANGGTVLSLYADGTDGEPVLTERISVSGTSKVWTKLDGISPYLKDGFIAAEDRKFYRHRGVDVVRTGFAAANEVFGFRPSFGASTLTQQLIKNISGDNDRSFRRKATEILRACRLEQYHDKDEIFEVYLNVIPFGEHSVGVGAACERYFGKTPSQITPAEAATLIGIANAPGRFHPYRHPQQCLEKRNSVLRVMEREGVITPAEAECAVQTPLTVLPERAGAEEPMSWFAETVLADVKRDLCDKLGMTEQAASRLIASGGLCVYTTENPAVQKIMEDSLENEERLPAAVKNGLCFAMCVCDSRTGDLVGIVGRQGKKDANRILNHATAPHTPGSVLKPIGLYAPLINEKRIHAATVFDDIPLEFHGNIPYPKNSPGRYDGLTTVADALRYSKNTVALQLYRMRGAEAVFNTLTKDFGLETLIRSQTGKDGGKLTDLAPAPLALGQLSVGVPLRKMTEAYTVFPAEGILRSGRSYTAVYGADGKLLLRNEKREKRVFSTDCARIMNTLLCGVTESGTASCIRLQESVDTAGKTGTSGGDRDRWFIGYTPYYTAGIWCGFEDGVTTVGKRTPSHLEIWDGVMEQIHAPILSDVREGCAADFSVGGLVRRRFCRDSGCECAQACESDLRGDRSAYAWFTADNAPLGICDRHYTVLYDGMSGEIAADRLPENPVSFGEVRLPEREFPVPIPIGDEQALAKSRASLFPNTEDQPSTEDPLHAEAQPPTETPPSTEDPLHAQAQPPTETPPPSEKPPITGGTPVEETSPPCKA